ncbi:DgyrCDS13922 [Dimorphilus gyrociliatus]|uniref:DgyrCDS13922 n=1 Tax=Dimorphilus gyrociliatus TaxID=2664684 RepID=A0A7I8WC24_9ANNE|nr:DgyrCDS13922 [Dimorphilus gyrociliatus]
MKDNVRIECTRTFDLTGRAGCHNLFMYTAQSNFSGNKYPLQWISRCRDNGFSVLLDAASFCSTSLLDLSAFKPDFCVVSFYKIFGFPTGLGALIVKNSSDYLLKKRYFGGGTILMALTDTRYHVAKKNLHERFEDGSLPFTEILALQHAMVAFETLTGGILNVQNYTFKLVKKCAGRLKSIQHTNGKKLIEIYSLHDTINKDTQGPVIAFNLFDASGNVIGYSRVTKLAKVFNIEFRTGCFCNLGACHYFLKLSDDEVLKQFDLGHVCGDDNDLINDKPTGAIRISFGYMTLWEDVERFLKFLTNFVDENKETTPTKHQERESCSVVIERICVYPIKSCAAFEIDGSWPILNQELLYDRQWMIITARGDTITQKKHANLCLVKPEIDLTLKKITLSYPGVDNLIISLK